ncbi:MAG: hypothetical protein COZ43_12255 [Sphingomonadales bacterium CG_4_10_14_3_um_filter_58_15]|nr:MAG: hypothetical protein COZ43_12255 [Sphingomonadales bacterium CG_4_10_14_3_um_filter_58_15]
MNWPNRIFSCRPKNGSRLSQDRVAKQSLTLLRKEDSQDPAPDYLTIMVVEPIYRSKFILA